MTDKHSTLRPATLKDLQDILAHAANHPAEHQRLANAPEDVLQRAGLFATPDAVDFLRSVGTTPYDEAAQKEAAKKLDPLEGEAGEM